MERSPSRVIPGRLRRRDDHGNGYFVLGFEVDEPIHAPPGTFAMVRSEAWGVAPLLPRPMSMLSAGEQPSILIKVIGEGTRRMADAPLGEAFTLHAPLGRGWDAPAADESPLLVAGGVGVAPLVYLAQELARAGTSVTTLYGGRSERDLPLADTLAAVGELGVTTEDGSRGTAGRITLLLERELEARQGQRTRIYCCGPHAMMAAVAAIAESRGLKCDASLEAPMGCGYGVCLGCPVTKRAGGFLYTCVDGPCVDAALVAWDEGVF